MKKTIRVVGWADGHTRASTVEVEAEIYGLFAVCRMTADDLPYRIVHVATGLAAVRNQKNITRARKLAKILTAQPGWDFATLEEFAPRRSALQDQARAAVDQVEARLR